MNDHQRIQSAEWWANTQDTEKLKELMEYEYARFETNQAFTPLEAFERHQASVEWLERELNTEFDGETVVVTHHAPSYQTLLEANEIGDDALNPFKWDSREAGFGRDPLNLARVACYASHLDYLVKEAHGGLWLHGHFHKAVRYALGGALVVSNPRGYASNSTSKPASNEEELERNERGNGHYFERNLLLDTNATSAVVECLLLKLAPLAETAAWIQAEVIALLPYLKKKDKRMNSLANDALQQLQQDFISTLKDALNEACRAVSSRVDKDMSVDTALFKLFGRDYEKTIGGELHARSQEPEDMQAVVTFLETGLPKFIKSLPDFSQL